MILKVDFNHINQHDEIICTVDSFSKKVIKEFVDINDRKEIFLRIYDDGRASYGVTVFLDPYHEGKYTWSSNAHDINAHFKLFGTEWQITEACFKELDHCGFGCGILVSLAEKLAEANQEKLKYGLIEYYETIESKRSDIVPAIIMEGMKVTDNEFLLLEDNFYHKFVRVEFNGASAYMRWSGRYEDRDKCLGDLLYKMFGVVGGDTYTNKTITLDKEKMKKILWEK